MSLNFVPRRATTVLPHLAVYDFLAPSLTQSPRVLRRTRCLSISSKRNATTATHSHETPPSDQLPRTPDPGPIAGSKPNSPKKPLTQAQRDFLTSALRVNQAGELAATLIYTAQTPPLINSHPHLRPLMKHMYDQEAGHFQTFNSLLAKHRVRPTALYPVWTVAASALGWGTAIMGREAAMACTEAVETEIGGHYNEQVKELLNMVEELEKSGESLGDDLTELIASIRRIRDEELEHLDYAVENDAKEAKPYGLLTGVIRAGCRGAIWITEKV